MSKETTKKGRLLITPKFKPQSDVKDFEGFDYVAISEKIEICFCVKNIGDIPIKNFVLSNILALNIETQKHFTPFSIDTCSVSLLTPGESSTLPVSLKLDRCVSGIFFLQVCLKSSLEDIDLYRECGDSYELLPQSVWKNSYRILNKIDAQYKRREIKEKANAKQLTHASLFLSSIVLIMSGLGIILRIFWHM